MKVEIIKCLKDNYSYVIIDEKYNPEFQIKEIQKALDVKSINN